MGSSNKKRCGAGLVRMLGADLISKLYAHPGIKMLAQASGDEVKGSSYISATVFIQALVGVLSTGDRSPTASLAVEERLKALKANLAQVRRPRCAHKAASG
jgi:hypothetical protein